jgi:hypothetical protein
MAEAEYEVFEWESESEAAERAPKRPSPAPSFKLRPAPGTPNAVTQAQLEAALTRVDGKIKTVADGVSTISTRVASLQTASKKEAEERKKGVEGTNKDLNQKLMMLAILPALVQPTFTIPAIPAGGSPAQTVSANSNALNLMLPVLSIAGTGFGTGSDSNSDSNMMMMMALVLALNPPKP